ncbi:MAG: hypothetical protein ACK2UA_19475 [Anaerolineae bacterium]
MARSKPAGSNRHTGPFGYGDAEATNTNSFPCPIDRDTDGNSHRVCYGDAGSHAYAY